MATDGQEFLVWKRQSPPLPSWKSPWGQGVPGWHLECYAMASQYLAVPVDLHGGGVDLVYPHHYAENEIALALERRPFSGCFLHTAFVTENGSKMSKSTGHLVPLRLALDRLGPGPLRWYLLSRPYNTSLEWSEGEALKARAELEQIRRSLVGSVASGAGGTLRFDELQEVVNQVRHCLEGGLHVDSGFDAIRLWSARIDAAGRGRFIRGETGRARQVYKVLERLVGISFLESN